MTTDLDTIEAKARQAEALPMSKSNGCVTLKISDVLGVVAKVRRLDALLNDTESSMIAARDEIAGMHNDENQKTINAGNQRSTAWHSAKARAFRLVADMLSMRIVAIRAKRGNG